MKKYLITIIAMFALGIFSGCNRIEPGYVGIKVNQAGSAKGVEDYPVQTGWVFYNFLTEKIYEYPVFQQNVTWSKDGPVNEEISFNCKGGSGINADVSMSGKFKSEKIPFVFVKFRKTPDEIAHGYLRNEVRDSLSRVASTYDPMDILGDKRSEFLDAVKKELDTRIADWWEIDYITFANKLRMDPRIEASINSIIEQKQKTQQMELQVKQVQAEAEQAVAKAKGEADSNRARAEGEAAAILTKAQAQAQANKLLTESLSAAIVNYEAIHRWNGQMPTMLSLNGSGGFASIVNLTSTNSPTTR